MRLVDTHAHLSDLDDREGVIKRAREAGIEAIVAVGGNLETSRATLGWADDYGGYVHPAVGIHPTEWMGDDVDETLRFIDEHIDRCVAVGEIGLDYWNREARKSEDMRERQREIYVRQLGVAVKHEKPASTRPYHLSLVQRAPGCPEGSTGFGLSDLGYSCSGVQQGSQGGSR